MLHILSFLSKQLLLSVSYLMFIAILKNVAFADECKVDPDSQTITSHCKCQTSSGSTVDLNLLLSNQENEPMLVCIILVFL